MDNPIKIMLAMSFFKASVNEASKTAREFSAALADSSNIVLGVETDGLERKSEEMTGFVRERLSEPWGERRVYVWDDSSDKRFFPNWPTHHPKPFYDGFSYGGTVNRLMALAAVAGCQYLVRVDPGTAPPYYFTEMLRQHIGAIESGKAALASGLYTDRIALRDDFVPQNKKGAYYDFVQLYTGVDPHKQITGGAAFTIKVTAGPPAIPFPGFTPVWASDDGLYTTIVGNKAVLFSESRVHRSDPGQAARHSKEYPVRLASMVVLRQLFSGVSESDAINTGMEFLQQLTGRGFYRQFMLVDANAELSKRAQNIVAGRNNYCTLRERWSEIVQEIARVASEHCECYVDAV